ncbi:MAG: ATP-binding protein, partial [Verrucomicrobiales bacterium]
VSIQVFTHLLGDQLDAEHHPMTADVRGIAASIADTTGHARQVARGMAPVVAEGGGLTEALRRLAESTADSYRVSCLFECPVPVSIDTPATANELYRIAQEAIHNALHHGRVKRIIVRLGETGGTISLAIIDDGCGLPTTVGKGPGMGLRVMRYRADLIGGQLGISSSEHGGTEVVCRIDKSEAEDLRWNAYPRSEDDPEVTSPAAAPPGI